MTKDTKKEDKQTPGITELRKEKFEILLDEVIEKYYRFEIQSNLAEKQLILHPENEQLAGFVQNQKRLMAEQVMIYDYIKKELKQYEQGN